MTTAILTLTEFLLARIAEDEESAREATSGRWQVAESWAGPNAVLNDEGHPLAVCGATVEGYDKPATDAEHIARHDPARVLAECEAKRRIVGVAMPGERDDAGERFRILRILA